MNKSGKILLVETHAETCGYLCGKLNSIAGSNEVVCFSSVDDASQYLNQHASDIFIVLQNFSSPALALSNSRNMVYMHEKFNIDSIAYMFLVQSKEDTVNNGLHTFIHCCYRPQNVPELPVVLEDVIAFWKEHVFPARLTRHTFNTL